VNQESRRDALGAVLSAQPGPRHEIINARGRPTDRALHCVRVHLDAAVDEEAHEAVPVLEAIADCAGNDRFAGDAREFAFEPSFKSIDERLTLWFLNSIYARARQRPCVTMFGFSRQGR
jgi:hypothetical protein